MLIAVIILAYLLFNALCALIYVGIDQSYKGVDWLGMLFCIVAFPIWVIYFIPRYIKEQKDWERIQEEHRQEVAEETAEREGKD